MQRSPLAVSLSVWKALILRESLSRLFSHRAAWFWLVAEPAVHIGFLMLIFVTIRVRHVGGIETPLWILVGLSTFLMFSRTERQAIGAVGANRALYAYRQVKPVDAVIARCVLEGVLMLAVSVILLVAAGLFGLHAWPADPLGVLLAVSGMWLIGVGFGMVGSVADELTPELGRLLGFLHQPLYLVSGVVFPIAALPPAYRDWLMLNPLAHGIELARLGFAPHYHEVPGTSLSFLWLCAVLLVGLGLTLQVGFGKRLVMQ